MRRATKWMVVTRSERWGDQVILSWSQSGHSQPQLTECFIGLICGLCWLQSKSYGRKMFLNNLITKVVKRSVVRFGVLDELIHRQNLKRCHGRGCGDSSENIAQLRQAFLLPINYTHGWIKEYFDVTAFMIHVCLCRHSSYWSINAEIGKIT